MLLKLRATTATTKSALLLIAVVAALSLPAMAQYTTPIAQSARSGALGGSLLCDFDGRYVALDWRRGYRLSALDDKTLSLQLPLGAGTALAAYSHRGTVDYHEQQAMAAYVMPLTNGLRAGMSARWLQRGTSDAHYESRQWLAPSALLQASWQATSLTLLAGTRPWDESRPWRMHLQAAYRPLPQLLTIAELECEERTRMRLGMEYIYDCWQLRGGMATQPVVLTFGLGMRRPHYSIDLAVEVHSALGITPQTTLALWF